MTTKAEKNWKGKKNTTYECETCKENGCSCEVVYNPIVQDEDRQYWSPKHQKIITPNERAKGIYHCDDEGISEGEWCMECECKNPIPILPNSLPTLKSRVSLGAT